MSGQFHTPGEAHAALSEELWKLYDSFRSWLDTRSVAGQYLDLVHQKVERCATEENPDDTETDKFKIPSLLNRTDQVSLESGLAMNRVRSQLEKTREVLEEAKAVVEKTSVVAESDGGGGGGGGGDHPNRSGHMVGEGKPVPFKVDEEFSKGKRNEDRWAARWKRVFGTGEDKSKFPLNFGKTEPLWHATSRDVAEKISESGKFLRGRTGMAGGGIYFADTIDKAKWKCRVSCPDESWSVFKVKVHSGKVKTIGPTTAPESTTFDELGKPIRESLTFAELYKNGYDSVLIEGIPKPAKKKNDENNKERWPTDSEYVVYDRDQVEILERQDCNGAGSSSCQLSTAEWRTLGFV